VVHQGRQGRIRQVFMPDVLPATLVGIFIACCSCIYARSAPGCALLSTEKHWSTAEYSTFYVFWASSAFSGCARPLARRQDRPTRRLYRALDLGAVFMTSGSTQRATSGSGYSGSGGVSVSRFLGRARRSPPKSSRPHSRRRQWCRVVHRLLRRIRVVAVRYRGTAAGYGSFALAFLTIPVFMVAMAAGSGLSSPSTPARSSTRSV